MLTIFLIKTTSFLAPSECFVFFFSSRHTRTAQRLGEMKPKKCYVESQSWWCHGLVTHEAAPRHVGLSVTSLPCQHSSVWGDAVRFGARGHSIASTSGTLFSNMCALEGAGKSERFLFKQRKLVWCGKCSRGDGEEKKERKVKGK